MNDTPLLTIAIPTYNRVECLRLLLDAIEPELRNLAAAGSDIELLVCNNASTDATASELQARCARGQLRVIENPTNIGADANVALCFTEARGRHVWICGDDDLPLPGVVERVAAFLRAHTPDLLYLPSRWHAGHLGVVPREPPAAGSPQKLDALQLAMRARAYMTFLSSWVVHRERYFTRRAADPHRFRGTSLVHMDWHLELLAANGDLYAAPSTWLLARAGNSGGYSVFQTFVANYHAILGQKLAGRGELRDFLQEDLLRGYLPGLVWGMRAGGLGRFEPMDWTNVERMIEQTWPQQLAARAWLSRIARWPRPFAKLAMGWCWLASRVWLNRMRLRLDRGMAA